MTDYWIFGVNPEPWTPGTAYRRGRGAGVAKNQKLVMYQEAVREEFPDQNPIHKFIEPGERIWFVFWRTATGPVADATNLQKALEDALQGLLWRNDRTNLDIRSTIESQGKGVEPAILVRILPPRTETIIPPYPQRDTERWEDSQWRPPEAEMF